MAATAVASTTVATTASATTVAASAASTGVARCATASTAPVEAWSAAYFSATASTAEIAWSFIAWLRLEAARLLKATLRRLLVTAWRFVLPRLLEAALRLIAALLIIPRRLVIARALIIGRLTRSALPHDGRIDSNRLAASTEGSLSLREILGRGVGRARVVETLPSAAARAWIHRTIGGRLSSRRCSIISVNGLTEAAPSMRRRRSIAAVCIGGPDGTAIEVLWGGNIVYPLTTDILGFGYRQIVIDPVATSTTSSLSIGLRDDNFFLNVVHLLGYEV